MDLITTPEFGESVFEASVGLWFKREGEAVVAGEPIVELHTDKAVQEINAVRDGVLGRILKTEDEVVQPGDALCEFNTGAEESEAVESGVAEAVSQDVEEIEPIEDESIQTEDRTDPDTEMIEIEFGSRTDSADMAAQDQMSLGSADVDVAASEKVEEVVESQPSVADSLAGILNHEEGRPSERVKLSRRRLTTARRMVQVQSESVMTTTFNEVDMQEVMRIRREHGEAFMSSHGVKLGLMSFFVKAVIVGLRSYPVLNAELDGDELIYKKHYDIGIAVASEDGLVVPVLRDADRMPFAGIEREIAEFATKGRSGSFSLQDLVGGTFTITNGGVFGSMMSTPILNPPQSGILGMHNIIERPVAIDGEVVIRPMMYLAVTYDHRIVEGAQAVQFLRTVKDALESAERLLLGS